MAEENRTEEPSLSEEASLEAYKLLRTSYQESYKLFYDFFKHVTTLSTGSILLLVAFLDKLFPHPLWRVFIVISLGAFILSALFSLILMAFFSNAMRRPGDLTETEYKLTGLTFIIIVMAFLSGMISLIVFAVKNLYR